MGAPIIFVRKKDGSFHICIYYKYLNIATMKNRFPICRIYDLFDQIKGAIVFSRIDLRSSYHQHRINEGDIPKTLFLTQFGQYEFVVVPFGLNNGATILRRLMNNVFRK